MTLPDATADLKDWLTDRRKFVPKQYDDWMQVVHDYEAGVKQSGPKLGKLVESSTRQIDFLLQSLFVANNSNRDIPPIGRFRRRVPWSVVNRVVNHPGESGDFLI